MDLLLQVWGGSFYLSNKIAFAFAEGKNPKLKRQLKLFGWLIYILGVPAWVIVLSMKHNWIAASIEFGGIPAMLFGLISVYKNTRTPSKYLDITAQFFTYTSVILGTGYSIYSHHGITSISQLLEIGVMIGFLMGSYYMAKNKSYGWIFFMIMNGSMGALMFIQHKPILAFQQCVSLCFVLYGYIIAIRTEKSHKLIREKGK